MTCGLLRSRKNIYVPDVDDDVMIESPMPVFLIEHPQGSVLFDTGPHPNVFKDAPSRWGGLAKAIRPIGDHKSGILQQLKTIGVTPASIRYVVNSHLHCDHAGGNQFFGQSALLVQKKEMECARNPQYEGNGYFRSDWDHPLHYEEIEGQVDIYGDGRLMLIPMPGHTAGHQMLLVRLKEQGTVILSGDCVPCRENYMGSKVSRTNMDDAEALRSIGKLEELVASEKGFLIYGHDPVQWAEIQKAPDYYS